MSQSIEHATLNSLALWARANYSIKASSALFILTLLLALGGGALALAPPVSAQESPAAAEVVGPVNINAANAETLAASLQGVGRSRAEEIVRYRETYGPFEAVEELTEVKGIGQSTLDRNMNVITLD